MGGITDAPEATGAPFESKGRAGRTDGWMDAVSGRFGFARPSACTLGRGGRAFDGAGGKEKHAGRGKCDWGAGGPRKAAEAGRKREWPKKFETEKGRRENARREEKRRGSRRAGGGSAPPAPLRIILVCRRRGADRTRSLALPRMGELGSRGKGRDRA